MSRTTVTLAYDRLRSCGLLGGRGGAGTHVSASARASTFANGQAILQFPVGTRREPEQIELTIGALEGSPIVAEVVSQVVRRDLADLMKLRGYMPLGLPDLRQRLADRLCLLGVHTRPEQLLVTAGAQQALDLIARELSARDTCVLLENPTYLGSIEAFRASGMRLIPVAVDEDGMRVDLARDASMAVDPRVLYVVPNFQNPTGAVLPPDRRRQLAELACERNFLIVEDLSPDLAFGAGLPPPIAAFDSAGRVVSVGSFNKLFWGGLRVGWVRGPTRFIERLGARKATSDHATSLLTQAVASRLLDRVDEQVALVGELVRERREAAISTLRSHLPDWSWREPAGGLSLWIRLPFGRASEFALTAERYGVVVRPGPLFSPSGGYEDHLRIAYGERPERVSEGIARLARAWDEYARPITNKRHMSIAISV